MADFVFNIAKGQTAYYASLPAANDALIVIPVLAAGVEADATLRDLDTVTQVFAGATDEQTTMGRKTITSVTVTVDDANDRVAIDTADVVWTAATGGAVSDLVLAYDNDTTGGTDANLVPLSMHDFAITPDGSDVQATVNDWIRNT